MAELVEWKLYCAICMYDPRDREVQPAVTVIEGYATCDDHTGYVAQGEQFYSILKTLASPRPAEPSSRERFGRRELRSGERHQLT